MEQQLKQRLVGAIVLVSLAVIFIPIILEGPGDEWAPRSSTIPAPPDLDYNATMELPLPAAMPGRVGKDADSPHPDSKPAEKSSVPTPVVKVPRPVVAAPAEKKPVVAKKTKQPAANNKLAQGWYVQIGSFSESVNASRLKDQFGSSDYAARIQATQAGKGKVYRVLIGPSGTRAAAEKTLARLISTKKASGIVIEISESGNE